MSNDNTVSVEPNPTEYTEQAERAENLVETDIQQLLEKVQSLTDERDQMKDQVLRAMADFQNFKRRNQQEMAQFRQFAVEKFVRDILPVLDNFERTITHLNQGASVENILEGIGAVERQLRTVLEAHSVTRIASVGTPFDPEVHEALGTEHHDEHPDDTVSTEIEPGYKMGEKVIRAAKVRVVKREA
jgi:molecular chaperone GrpE